MQEKTDRKRRSRTLPYGSEEVLRTEVNGKETVVCENRYALPLGYTYDQAMTQEELEQYDVLDRQEVMMQSVMLDEKTMTAWEKLQGEDEALEVKKKSMEEEKDATEQKKSMDEETNAPKQMESLEEETDASGQKESAEEKKDAARKDAQVQVTSEILDFKVKGENGLVVTDGAWTAAQDKAKAKLKFESLPHSETYLVLKNAVLEGDMSEEPINLTFKTKDNKLGYSFRSDDDRYGSGQKDYVFNLGYHEEPISSCQLIMNRAGEIKFDRDGALQPADGSSRRVYSRSLQKTCWMM